MCAIGASELDDQECELVALHLSGDHVTAVENIPPPRTARVDEVLTSLLFNVNIVSGSTIRHQLERFTRLVSKQEAGPITAEEAAELRRLRDEVSARFHDDKSQTRLLDVLSAATSESLERQIRQMSGDELKASIDFVAQLRKALTERHE